MAVIILMAIIILLTRKMRFICVILGATAAFILLALESAYPYGHLEHDIGKPFVSSLLITSITGNQNFSGQTATCKILNRKNEKILVNISGEKVPRVNDIITTDSLKIQCPEMSSNSKTVDYGKYLKSKDIRYTADLNDNDFKITDRNKGFLFARDARSLNRFLYNRIHKIMPEKRTAALVSGILLGADDDISQEDYSSFALSGCIHIVSVSGFHVMLILNILYALMFKASKHLKSVISLFFIIFFILLTGCSPSVIRAGVMVVIYIIIGYIDHDRDPELILCAIAIGLILTNPYIIYNTSFILTVSATFGLLKCTPFIENRLSIFPAYLRSIAATTMGAQIGILPAMVNCFGYVTIYSIVINLVICLVLPLLFIISAIGIITGLSGFSVICSFLCNVIYVSSGFIAKTPFNVLLIEHSNLSICFIILCMLLVCSIFENLNRELTVINIRESK